MAKLICCTLSLSCWFYALWRILVALCTFTPGPSCKLLGIILCCLHLKLQQSKCSTLLCIPQSWTCCHWCKMYPRDSVIVFHTSSVTSKNSCINSVSSFLHCVNKIQVLLIFLFTHVLCENSVSNATKSQKHSTTWNLGGLRKYLHAITNSCFSTWIYSVCCLVLSASYQQCRSCL